MNRSHWGLAALGLLAGLWLAWAMSDRQVHDVAVSISAASHPTVPVRAAALPVAVPQQAERGPLSSSPLPTPRSVQATVDACGLGRVPVAEHQAVPVDALDIRALPQPIGAEPLNAARAALLAQLRSGDERLQTIALLLERPAAPEGGADQAWSNEVLQRARSSGQADVLRWSAPACAAQPDPAACRMQLVRERLRQEPDNAVHWVDLANEDPGAADEAWAGLLKASRWHERPHALLLTTQAALPTALPGYLRMALGAEMQQQASLWPAPAEGFVLERCQQPGPDRAKDCGALAQLMEQHSDSMRSLTEASSVARAAGWTEARVGQMHESFHAMARWARAADPSSKPMSCNSVANWDRHVAELGQHGELGALRSRTTVAVKAMP